MTITPEVHRDHLEELRNLARQIREVTSIGDRRKAMGDRLAAVEYAIGVLEANPPGRDLRVVVNDGGESSDQS